MTAARPPRRHPGWVLAPLTALALAASLLALPGPSRAQEGAPNLVSNADFEQGTASWWGLEDADVDADQRQACIDFPDDGAQFGNYTDLGLQEGGGYVFGFTAWGTPAAEGLMAFVETDGGAVRDVAEAFDVTPEPQEPPVDVHRHPGTTPAVRPGRGRPAHLLPDRRVRGADR